MITMLETIAPKSVQMNADDLMAGQTKTIKITKVTLIAGEQPCSLYYEGDNGKPYKPGLSMRRVLVRVWGDDANNYIGRSLTLYCDPKVTFGGTEVGGIRIANMSDIDKPITIALTASQKSRKPFTVKPLIVGTSPSADDFISDIQQISTIDGLKHKFAEATKVFKDSKDFARIHEAKEKRKLELSNDTQKEN